MRRQTLTLFVVLFAIAVTAPAAAGHGDHHQTAAYGEKVGTVDFPVSCNEEAAKKTSHGLALMHHMTYEGAQEVFAAAAAADADCAMAHWGQAMTLIHPLWSDPLTEEEFAAVRSHIETAKARGAKTERERGYIAAVEAYLDAGWSASEKANLAAFEKGWQAVHERFPDDQEAALLYALAHLATADPADKTYAHQKRAGAIAEGVLARIPSHPGGHHYAIHAYDYPPLAEKALEVARRYGDIAPAVPHALHMPTHIFTRLGLWSEAIDWNRRSSTAALHHPVEGAISTHHLHAVDYLAYAHLQLGADQKAQALADELRELKGPFQADVATPYAFAAVPARLALERQRWAEAARLEPRVPADLPWDRVPAVEAITHFARALGAARSGQPEVARQAVERLAALRDEAAKTSAYWSQQVEIQRLSALAWLTFAQGDREEGLATMRAAAELEASTDKHPVTPGEVLPARELLAEMLIETGTYTEAQAAYEATLARSPGRLNSLYGLGRAAELAGDAEVAKRHFQRLLDATSGADAGWERIAHARAFVAKASAVGG